MLTHPWAQCCIFFCRRPAAAGSSAPQPQTCTSAAAPDGSRTDHPGPPEPSPKKQINFHFATSLDFEILYWRQCWFH
jgi:hypothetical protein